MESTREKTRAHQNPFTLNPGIIADAIKTKTAFITKVKSQKVRIFIGSVRIIRIGFKTVFRIPKTTAITIAVIKFSILIPGRI